MRVPYLLILLMAFTTSCSIYKQDIMLNPEEGSYQALSANLSEAERNYLIQANDRLKIEVYTNSGERLIDPDFQLQKELGALQNNGQRLTPEYLVQTDGTVRLPMVGSVKLAGLTLAQADLLLQSEFSKFYKAPYVLTQYNNKRVIVLGAIGGQVIPIVNENTNVLEVLALSGGIAAKGKAHNIRLIRGDLANPYVQVIDLSTIKGMQQASLKVESGDIIYVEPIRRLLPETIRDITPILGVISNVITLTVLIISLNN